MLTPFKWEYKGVLSHISTNVIDQKFTDAELESLKRTAKRIIAKCERKQANLRECTVREVREGK